MEWNRCSKAINSVAMHVIAVTQANALPLELALSFPPSVILLGMPMFMPRDVLD
jgi:hypothetical protein